MEESADQQFRCPYFSIRKRFEMTKKLKTACDIGQKIEQLTIVAELPKNIRG
jgi:hypothetical protein